MDETNLPESTPNLPNNIELKPDISNDMESELNISDSETSHVDIKINFKDNYCLEQILLNINNNGESLYKTDIKPICSSMTELILQLKPVQFKYKNSDTIAYGLVEEQVYKILPQITPLDKNGYPYTINYDLLCVFLLQFIQSKFGETKL